MAGVGLRQARKAATRERVLAAARQLFAEIGYEAATIRQIALLAGVSVGSVFTTFASKGDILSQVMEERLEGLYAELDQVIPRLAGSTAERLKAMFAIHFAFETQYLRLFLAHIAAAFDWTLAPTARPFGRNLRLRGLVLDCLAKGVADGDVGRPVDLEVVLDALVAAYAWTYRLAVWDDADAATLSASMDRQIDLIAAGFRPR